MRKRRSFLINGSGLVKYPVERNLSGIYYYTQKHSTTKGKTIKLLGETSSKPWKIS